MWNWCGQRAGLCVPECYRWVHGLDFAGEVAVSVTSPAVLAGDVATGVASQAAAGAVSLVEICW